MTLGGAEIWFWSHGQEWESRGGLVGKVRTGSALMALVIDTNTKYTSPRRDAAPPGLISFLLTRGDEDVGEKDKENKDRSLNNSKWNNIKKRTKSDCLKRQQ
ncbi:hypothetical protein AV530_006333 [Patagioenas fasciata monilis]|uniref:Uncharacterized protein n=1 Tax=Patagioenas fasciata monilis TaxID=372326 RepID=A0A1V4KGC5_PATFA|nr:hypothetical protein AV530_006333 [Patagioenas fasciata monilis]